MNHSRQALNRIIYITTSDRSTSALYPSSSWKVSMNVCNLPWDSRMGSFEALTVFHTLAGARKCWTASVVRWESRRDLKTTPFGGKEIDLITLWSASTAMFFTGRNYCIVSVYIRSWGTRCRTSGYRWNILFLSLCCDWVLRTCIINEWKVGKDVEKFCRRWYEYSIEHFY